MGTKQQTNQQSQFAPSGMGAYNQMQAPMANAATGYMQNPFGNPFFQQQQQMGTRQAENLGQTGMNNITQNLTASGLMGGASSPVGLEMMQNQARANSGLQAQMGFMNPVNNAMGMQQNAMGLASGYRPLQTGSNQVQSQTGLGTWLPQLLGAAVGGLTGMGGLGSLGSLFGGGGGGGGSSLNSQAFGQGNPFSGGMYSGLAGAGGGGQYNLGVQGMGGGGGGGAIPPPPMPSGPGMNSGMGW